MVRYSCCMRVFVVYLVLCFWILFVVFFLGSFGTFYYVMLCVHWQRESRFKLYVFCMFDFFHFFSALLFDFIRTIERNFCVCLNIFLTFKLTLSLYKAIILAIFFKLIYKKSNKNSFCHCLNMNETTIS